MNLSDLVRRKLPPAAWEEGEKIPWNDPAFSERMLAEHLTQVHDLASRTTPRIDRHVAWIFDGLLEGRAVKVLDLGCGPGLYASRLARRGCECVGIDFSPAAIAHAAAEAERDGLTCTYVHDDIRSAAFGSGYGLVMLIFGEFNAFRPSDAAALLGKARAAVADDGLLLLEPQTFDAVRQTGRPRAEWQTHCRGLWCPRPHLYLAESFWDEGASAAITRCFILEADGGEITSYSASTQAYTDEQLGEMLRAAGFEDIRFRGALGGVEDPVQAGVQAVTARPA